MTRSIMQDFRKPDHNHAACVVAALAQAEALCQERGERLTPLRKRVLQLVWDSHKAVKAYDLLDHLSAGRKRAAPPTVYRALEFLDAAGLIHRIESLNAFVGCDRPTRRHSAQFLICTGCATVAEIDDTTLSTRIGASAKRQGFVVTDAKIEVAGLCRECQ